jgi:hypothetical protein
MQSMKGVILPLCEAVGKLRSNAPINMTIANPNASIRTGVYTLFFLRALISNSNLVTSTP